ncbi:MAG TPA: hypothetical protein VN030_03235 [Cellvibrio sp.]|nr:hypothetical protein [Cellvibrio sp.]
MSKPAAPTTRSEKKSQPSVAANASASAKPVSSRSSLDQPPAVTSLLPPVYLSGKTSSLPALDSSTLLSGQASYSRQVCEGITQQAADPGPQLTSQLNQTFNKKHTEKNTSSVVENNPGGKKVESSKDKTASAKNEKAKGSTKANGDADTSAAEKSETTTAEGATGGGSTGAAAEAVGEQPLAGTALNETAEAAIEGAVAGAAAASAPAKDEDYKNIEVMVAKAPKLLPIATPRVPSPPAQAIARRQEIIKRTGNSPEQHCANIRQSVESAAQAARDAQRRMVWQLGNIGRDSRISIENMADEIPKATAAAIGQINAAIKQASKDINDYALAETNHISKEKVLTGEKMEESRTSTTVTVTKKLIAAGDEVKKLDAIATGQFNARIGQAKANVSGLPKSGVAPTLTSTKKAKADAKAKAEGKTDSKKETPAPKAATEEKTYKTVEETKKPIDDAATKQIEVSGKAGEQTKAYMNMRVAPVKLGAAGIKDKELVSSAESFNKMMDSESSRAEFTTMVLGLTTPMSTHHKKDKAKAVDPVDLKAELAMTSAEQDVAHANKTINQKRDQGIEYCEKDLRENLVSNIEKAGRKAYLGLREQAGSTEIALVNAAIPMAVAYRELIGRIDALLPQKQFLDSRDLVPKLLAARNSAETLRQQHETAGKQQAGEALQEMEKVKKEQVDGLLKSAQEAAQSVGDVTTQTAFDMALYAGQMTGKMSASSEAVITSAQAYASKVAKRLLDSLEKTREEGLENLDDGAVNYLNGYISGAQKSQYRTLAAFVKQMEAEDSPLVSSIKSSKSNLETRAKELQDAMPEISAAKAVGLSLIPVIGGIASAVYVYKKDANENKVLQQLGGIQWPGPPAIAEAFTHFGNLEDRINSRMAEPQKGTALTLLKGTAEERKDARVDAIKNSTGLLDYNSRETREALAQGMNAEERGTMSPEQVKELTDYLQNNLKAEQADITSGYISGNTEQVAAARSREAVDKGQKEGEWGWIFSAEAAQKRSDEARVEAIAKMDAVLRDELRIQSDFIDESQIEEKNRKVIREFAAMIASRDKDGRPKADDIPQDKALAAVKAYASKGHYSAVLGPANLIGITNVERVEMGTDAKNFIDAALDDPKGVAGEKAKIARGIYELKRAKADGKPSETTQTRLSDAFENRELATFLRKANDESLPLEERIKYKRLAEDARAKNQRVMQGIVAGLKENIPEDIKNDPKKSEAWMAEEMGKLFALTDVRATTVSHARYGREMILGGRASLDAGVALATDKSGTHEDLLTRSYTDRTKSEIATANKRWKQEHNGEDMEEMLGIKKRELTTEDKAMLVLSPIAFMALRGAETSGDLTMQLERLAEGNRESDLDYVKYAALHYQQERVRGTGFIAEHTMEGTKEAEYLDSEREQLAKTILAAARSKDPELAAKYENNPSAIFADGKLDPAIEQAAFENGKLRGSNSLVLRDFSEGVSFAAEAYRAEIDRQESMLTTGISVLALIASVALMVIPGVNIIAAGVIATIVAGAATIAVKAGMRGERYGWEEAATDIAMTAIEAATAGVGGAMAGGLGKTGLLARIGETLVARLGKVGGAIAREVMVNAVSSAAQVAMQDNVWSDGFARGLERVASGAIRGAVIAAVTTGLSEAITKKLTPALHVGDLDPSKIKMSGGMAQRIGPHGREMLREALTNGISNIAGEMAGVMIDYATGQFHGTFLEAMGHVGMSGMREMMMGAARGGIMSKHRETYRNLLDAARSGGPLSVSQLRALRAFGISAGALHYDNDLNHVLNEVQGARSLLQRMPVELREQAKTLDSESLHNIVAMLERGSLGAIGDWKNPAQKDFLSELASSVPGLDTQAFMRALELAVARRQAPAAETEIEAGAQSQLRLQLGAHLHESAKGVLDNIPLHGLQYLGEAELSRAAAMIASGEFNGAHADALYRAAQKNNPQLDEFAFLSNLHKAVSNSQQFHEAQTRAAISKRKDILAMVPEDAAPIFTQLPDADLALAHKLIQLGEMGSAHEQAALQRAAQMVNPELGGVQFQQFMTAAVEQVQARKAAEAGARRGAREERMTQVPEELRGILSALPEAGLVELRLRQMEGDLSPAEKNRLLKMAERETPDVDLLAMADALERAVKHTTLPLASETEMAAMRKNLISAIPADQQHLVESTRIMVLPAEEFIAFTRSQKGQAVTLIINGEAVIVVRHGADAKVLREEGIHALQARDKRWASHIGSLEEYHLSQWDSLPLEQQILLYRNKVALELDAQARMIHSLESDIQQASNPLEKNALQKQLAQVKNAYENLARRGGEVGALDALAVANIKAGFSEKPQWLEQPARLFNKAELTEAEQRERDALIVRVSKSSKAMSPEQAQLHEATARSLDLASLRLLMGLHSNIRVVRDIFSLAHQSGNAQAFIQQAQHLTTRVGTEAAIRIIRSEDSSRLLQALARAGEPRALDRIINHSTDVNELQRTLDRLGAAAEPGVLVKHVNNILSLLTPGQAMEFTSRLAFMEFANVPDHVLAFSHLANSIADPTKVQLLMSLVSKMDASDYFSFVFNLNLLSSGPLSQFDQHLGRFAGMGVFNKGHLLSRVIEMAATQREWKSFFADVRDFSRLVNRLPNTSDNQNNIRKVMGYLLNPNDQPVHLAADLIAATNALRASADPQKILQGQVARLQTAEARLMGGDAWQIFLDAQKIEWNTFKNNPHNSEFAKLLSSHPSTQGWSEGQLGAISEIRPWFEHLAKARAKALGVVELDAKARADLLTEIFSRGFGSGVHQLSSEGKLTELNRAFRELAVEAVTGINIRSLSSAAPGPLRMKEAIKQLGIDEAQLAARPDKDILQKHIYELATRQEFYEMMRVMDTGKTSGIQQNITEVIGEIALTQHMLAREKDYTLATPFGKGTGFDQVWIKRNAAGEIIDFIVGEAKGPGAQLGDPDKGGQMTAKWVFNTVKEMIASSDAHQRWLGEQMMKAIMKSRKTGKPLIRGLVIEADKTPGLAPHNRSSAETGQNGYDFSSFVLTLGGP